MRIPTTFLVAGISLLAASAFAQTPPADGPYKVLKTAKVGGPGGFDYVYADSDARKLYIARSGGRGNTAVKSRMTVFDLDTLQPAGEIPDTNGVHGAAVDPKSNHGFTSSNPVVMFDAKTLAPIKTIKLDGSPDGIFLEPATQRIYVLSHRDPNVSVIDAKDGSIVGTIDLGGAPEQGQSDADGHVYIDVEDQDNIAVVDANSLKVTAHYDLGTKGLHPAGLGLDAKNHILFACCRSPASCVILNADNGKILATLPIGSGVDGAAFNPNTMEAFSSQGDGSFTIIKENSPTSFEVEQNLKVMRSAKTCTLDSKTNQIFLIAAEYAPPSTQPATTQRRGGGGGRGQIIPDSFTIIAIGK